MSLLDTIDAEALAGMSRQERLNQRKDILKKFLKSDKKRAMHFLEKDDEGRGQLKDQFYSKLTEKNPDFGRYVVGEKSHTSYAQMYLGGTGKPVTTKTPIYGQIYDDKTEYLYDAIEKGLVATDELDQDSTVFMSGLMNQRKSTRSGDLQRRAQGIAQEMGIGEGLAEKGGMSTGVLKPFADVAAWGAEKVGMDLSERDRTKALLHAAYPSRVAYENWGEVLGVLGGSVGIYSKLAQKGLSTVVRKEGAKRAIAGKALATTAGVEFGLGAAYNQPTMILGGDDPSRLMSGLEAMFLGSALNLAVDTVLPLRGMTKQNAIKHLDELDPPKWKEVRDGIFADVDPQAPPSPQNIAIAEQMRDAQTPGMVPMRESLEQAERAGKNFEQLQGDLESKSLQQALDSNQLQPPTSTPISEGVGPASIPENTRVIEIDERLSQLNQRQQVLESRRGLSKKERKALNQEKHALVTEKVKAQTFPHLTREEQLAEEALPGSVLGITPYAAITDEMAARAMKEVILRTHVGSLAAMSPTDEENGRLTNFVRGWIAADPRAWKSLGKGLGKVMDAPGMAWSRTAKDWVSKGTEKNFVPMDKRIEAIDPVVFNSLRRMELKSSESLQNNMEVTVPFLERVNKLKKDGALSDADIEDLTLAVFNRDLENRNQVLARLDPSGELANGYNEIDKMLGRLREEGNATGMDIKFLENYFPRHTKDYDGLLKQRGWEKVDAVEKAFREFKKKSNRAPNKEERIDIANKVISQGQRKAGTTYTKERVLETLERGDLPFYSSMQDSLMSYVFDISRRIERRKFLGTAYKPGKLETKKTGFPGSEENYTLRKYPKEQPDALDDTIGSEIMDMIERRKAAGGLDAGKADELYEMLTSRLVLGDSGPGPAMQAWRNIHYLSTIGNPFSTLTQFTDIATAASKNATVTGNVLGKALRGKKLDYDVTDYGINHPAEELMVRGNTGKFLDWVLKFNKFKAVDRLGKNIHLNSAYGRLKKMASAPEESAAWKAFVRDQQPRFGADFDNLVQALRNGDKADPNVKLAVFNELADIQPITLSGMPETYVRSGNARLFYSLKSFTIKQVDYVRKNMIDRIAKAKTPAEVKEGMANYARFVILFGGANMGINTLKDFILGRDIDVKDEVSDAWMQVIGLSRYQIYKIKDFEDQAASGRTESAIYNMVGGTLVPGRLLFDLGTDAARLKSGEMEGLKDVTTVRNVPVAGKYIYYRHGEGKEKQRKRRIRNIPSNNFDSGFSSSDFKQDF